VSRYDEFQTFREDLNEKILARGTTTTKRFFTLDTKTYEPGALDGKTKELLGLSASMVLRCDDCIAYHVDQAVKAGATDEELFETFDIALIVGGSIVIPHLRRAVELYARLNRTSTERDVYAGAVNQLSVATIILDELGRVLTINDVGRALLDQADGLSLRGEKLHIDGRDINRELEDALSTIIQAQRSGKTSVVRALRVPRAGGRADLGLVIRPVPGDRGTEGQAIPSAAVFVSDPELEESTSQQILGELFDLTPAESRLATLLARGLSLSDVSRAQNISQHTVRAQLKSIFAKTGVSRQAELVRLVLKSAASLA